MMSASSLLIVEAFLPGYQALRDAIATIAPRWTCEHANSAEIAVERLLSGQSLPTAVICDLALEDIPGEDFYASLSQHGPQGIRWILISDDLLRLQRLKLGPDAICLPKPLARAGFCKLAATLVRYLDQGTRLVPTIAPDEAGVASSFSRRVSGNWQVQRARRRA
ncbi:MAG: response regulator transcription factor [Planctomycetes bacterium]|nr:response regulator transcription factor [Planctomycetota bacterium]